MRKIMYINSKQVESLAGEQFYLDYYILEEEMQISESISIMTYGVEITKRSGELVESKTVHAIMLDKHAIVNFVALLADNTVTPATLNDVVMDYVESGTWISSSISDPIFY